MPRQCRTPAGDQLGLVGCVIFVRLREALVDLRPLPSLPLLPIQVVPEVRWLIGHAAPPIRLNWNALGALAPSAGTLFQCFDSNGLSLWQVHKPAWANLNPALFGKRSCNVLQQ